MHLDIATFVLHISLKRFDLLARDERIRRLWPGDYYRGGYCFSVFLQLAATIGLKSPRGDGEMIAGTYKATT